MTRAHPTDARLLEAIRRAVAELAELRHAIETERHLAPAAAREQWRDLDRRLADLSRFERNPNEAEVAELRELVELARGLSAAMHGNRMSRPASSRPPSSVRARASRA